MIRTSIILFLFSVSFVFTGVAQEDSLKRKRVSLTASSLSRIMANGDTLIEWKTDLDSGMTLATKEGRITVHTSPEMDELFEKYIRLSEEKRIPINGYRVQIASASGNNAKSNVNTVKSRFLTNYPDVPAYLIWESPNYKIRVGNFRSKLDAEKFQRTIDELFPYAFIVRDDINFPKLGKQEEEE